MGNAIQKSDDFHPMLRWWRSYHGYAVLRLRVAVHRASGPFKRPGELVLARWHAGKPFATGWMLQNVDFACVLNEPDVEVIERP